MLKFVTTSNADTAFSDVQKCFVMQNDKKKKEKEKKKKTEQGFQHKITIQHFTISTITR